MEAKYLTKSEVLKRISFKRSTFDRWVAKGDFPPPTLKKDGFIRWHIDAIKQWEMDYMNHSIRNDKKGYYLGY